MRIPGWWRVRHFYNRRRDELLVVIRMATMMIHKHIEDYRYWKTEGRRLRKIEHKKFKKGVNIIGLAKGDFGLAENTRLAAHTMKTTNISFCVNNSGNSGEHSVTNKELDAYLKNDPIYSVNLFAYNADYTIHYVKKALEDFEQGTYIQKQYKIGYGYWELSLFPNEWKEQDNYLDEIWAPTLFIKEILEKYTKLPVYYMPIAVDFKIPVGYTKSQFGLPEDRLLYLFTFDMSSFSARKNPEAVIAAFISAFPVEKNEAVCLVIKISRIHTNPEHQSKADALKQQVAFDSRIHVIDEILDRKSILGLISVCDCYVSLHRAEGFGLGMAEAMKMGKVVIGTNYSGNKDFMNERNSCLVDFDIVPVRKDEYALVEDGAVWAEPKVSDAVSYMRKIYEDPEYRKQKSAAAQSDINTYRNFKIIGTAYKKRLKEIFKQHKR